MDWWPGSASTETRRHLQVVNQELWSKDGVLGNLTISVPFGGVIFRKAYISFPSPGGRLEGLRSRSATSGERLAGRGSCRPPRPSGLPIGCL